MTPYTCKLLIRIDKIIYTLKGVVCYFEKHGYLVASGVEWVDFKRRKLKQNIWIDAITELPTHFPNRLFKLAFEIQVRWKWTKKFLSY